MFDCYLLFWFWLLLVWIVVVVYFDVKTLFKKSPVKEIWSREVSLVPWRGTGWKTDFCRVAFNLSSGFLKISLWKLWKHSHEYCLYFLPSLWHHKHIRHVQQLCIIMTSGACMFLLFQPLYCELLKNLPPGPVVGDLLEEISAIFKCCLNPDKDPEMRLKFFALLSRLVLSSATTINSKNRFGEFAQSFVRDIILPNCVWRAGRTAGAIRTTAVSCLWALLQSGVLTKERVGHFFCFLGGTLVC